jgi:hypothetical protein
MAGDFFDEPEEMCGESKFQRALVRVCQGIAGPSPPVIIQGFGVDIPLI